MTILFLVLLKAYCSRCDDGKEKFAFVTNEMLENAEQRKAFKINGKEVIVICPMVSMALGQHIQNTFMG
jgi:hypothetical protein